MSGTLPMASRDITCTNFILNIEYSAGMCFDAFQKILQWQVIFSLNANLYSRYPLRP